MKTIQCPDHHVFGFDPIVFMAGGILNCPDWQSSMVNMLNQEKCKEELILINPRRINFSDAVADKQIEWEHSYLKMADAVSFWFPSETLCPITLFELGCMASAGKKIFVGCDPKYQRIFDVRKQLQMRRPEVKVHTSLSDVVKEIVDELRQGKIHNARSWHL